MERRKLRAHKKIFLMLSLVLMIICRTQQVMAIDVNKTPTVFFQTDIRWSSVPYGHNKGKASTIGKSGCGLLALRNAVYYLNGELIDPAALAKFSEEHDCYLDNAGTSWALFPKFIREEGARYHIRYVKSIDNYDYTALRKYLSGGCAAICGWTNKGAGGHIMCLVNYNPANQKYLLLDSNVYPGTPRRTYPTGYVWLTEAELKDIGVTGSFDIIGNASVSPEGKVDRIDVSYNTVSLKGWAFDRDDPSGSLEIDVYIGGQYAGALRADQSRPDVDRAYKMGSNHGFEGTISTQKYGKQLVQVRAVNIGSTGEDTFLASETVDIPRPTISLNRTKYTLSVKEKVTLKATVKGPSQNVTWTSDNSSVATVTGAGVVTGKKSGTTVIRARANHREATCKITVQKPSIRLNPKSKTIYVKQKFTIKATIIGKKHTAKWVSLNPVTATVDSKGTVTGRHKGTAIIMASANGKIAKCKVTVRKNAVGKSKVVYYYGGARTSSQYMLPYIARASVKGNVLTLTGCLSTSKKETFPSPRLKAVKRKTYRFKLGKNLVCYGRGGDAPDTRVSLNYVVRNINSHNGLAIILKKTGDYITKIIVSS